MKPVIAVAAASVIAVIALPAALPAHAQQVSGALVTVSGSADIKADNDQAVATFFIEEQDKEKDKAASRVNQKMKTGTDIIKKEDPQALLTTRGYYTYPVYADEVASASSQPRKRTQTGWRVGQYLEVKTQNLKQLPATTAVVQKVLALNGLSFGLSDAAAKKLEAERLEASYKNLLEKVGVIAAAMGRKPVDAVIESVNFDGNDNAEPVFRAAPMMMAKSSRMDADVAEPSFEPGITTLNARVVGKIRLK
ncbi:SIMPL domain-containing protein [Undibacterium sp. TJN25]|uniref:SIMPL domain-containing protein n=1 Tax=Undibacterium sp. TJN25 TaxID=3413056 RepID=UPI003BF279E0